MIWRLALAVFLMLCLCVVGRSPHAQFNGCSSGFCVPSVVSGTHQVVLDACGTADVQTASGTSLTFSNLTIGVGANRALEVEIAYGGAAAPTGVTVTWDNGGTNQAMTRIGAQTVGSAQTVELWGLVAPTSGNKTLVASWTGANQTYVDACAWTGVKQAGGTTSFPGFTSNTGVTTVAVPSAVGNIVMGVSVSTSANGVPTGTQIFRDTSGAVINASGSYDVGASTVNIGTNATMGAVAGNDISAN